MAVEASVPPLIGSVYSFCHDEGLMKLQLLESQLQKSSVRRPPPPAAAAHNLFLTPGQLLSFKLTQSASLQLRSGRLWVTQADDRRDHFLKAGHSLCLAPYRLTVLQSERGSANVSLRLMATPDSTAILLRVPRNLWRAVRKFSF
jgi:hypothetical protein